MQNLDNFPRRGKMDALDAAGAVSSEKDE